MIYNSLDIVIVPFPFTDSFLSKSRPALVISNCKFNTKHGYTTLFMITTASNTQWPSDFSILNLGMSGLSVSSVIRFKTFTIDNRLIRKKIGMLEKNVQRDFKEKYLAQFF